jgi:hypothetical protein
VKVRTEKSHNGTLRKKEGGRKLKYMEGIYKKKGSQSGS